MNVLNEFNYMILLSVLIGIAVIRLIDVKFLFRWQDDGKDNPAIALRNAGTLLGATIAFSAVGMNAWPDGDGIVSWLIEMAFATLFLALTVVVSDKLILRDRHNASAIQNGDMQTAVVDATARIITGMIAFASIYGEGTYLSSIAWFIVGQLFMILVYEIQRKLNDNNEKTLMEIIKGSVSLLAMGAVVSASIFGDSKGFAQDFVSTSLYMMAGMNVILLFRIFEDSAVKMLSKGILNNEAGYDMMTIAYRIAGAFVAVLIVSTS